MKNLIAIIFIMAMAHMSLLGQSHLGIKMGASVLNGDINTNIRPFNLLGFSYGKQIKEHLSVNVGFSYGVISHIELIPYRHQENGGVLTDQVYSPYINADIWFPNFRLATFSSYVRMDWTPISNSGNSVLRRINPLLSLGGGFNRYNTYLNLLDEVSNTYDFGDIDRSYSVFEIRDKYDDTFETKYSPGSTTSAFFEIGLGSHIIISDIWSFKIKGALQFTGSDHLDGLGNTSGNASGSNGDNLYLYSIEIIRNL